MQTIYSVINESERNDRSSDLGDRQQLTIYLHKKCLPVFVSGWKSSKGKWIQVHHLHLCLSRHMQSLCTIWDNHFAVIQLFLASKWKGMAPPRGHKCLDTKQTRYRTTLHRNSNVLFQLSRFFFSLWEVKTCYRVYRLQALAVCCLHWVPNWICIELDLKPSCRFSEKFTRSLTGVVMWENLVEKKNKTCKHQGY